MRALSSSRPTWQWTSLLSNTLCIYIFKWSKLSQLCLPEWVYLEKNALSIPIQIQRFFCCPENILLSVSLSPHHFVPPKNLKANQIQGLLRLNPRYPPGWWWTNPLTAPQNWMEIFFLRWIFYISPTWIFGDILWNVEWNFFGVEFS